jgi:imidazolonepropionase
VSVVRPVVADLVIGGIRELVTCDASLGDGPLGVITDGLVAVRDGTIVAVGRELALRDAIVPTPQVDRLDARGAVVVPGVVDSHTHLVFAGSREREYALRAGGASYQEIAAAGGGILATVGATRAATIDELVNLALPRLRLALAHGTTTMEVKSGYALNPAGEIKMLESIRRLDELQAVDLHATFCGAHEVPPEFRGSHRRLRRSRGG